MHYLVCASLYMSVICHCGFSFEYPCLTEWRWSLIYYQTDSIGTFFLKHTQHEVAFWNVSLAELKVQVIFTPVPSQLQMLVLKRLKLAFCIIFFFRNY